MPIGYNVFLETNHVEYDYDSAVSYSHDCGKVENSTDELRKIFGVEHTTGTVGAWRFKFEGAKFLITEIPGRAGWFLACNVKQCQHYRAISTIFEGCQKSRTSGRHNPQHRSAHTQHISIERENCTLARSSTSTTDRYRCMQRAGSSASERFRRLPSIRGLSYL